MWEKLLLDYFENEMRAHLKASHFTRIEGQLLFTWSSAGIALENLTSSGQTE